MESCYGCCKLIQSSDGECGCLKFSDPYNVWEAHHLDDQPVPLYDDCYEAGSRTEGK